MNRILTLPMLAMTLAVSAQVSVGSPDGKTVVTVDVTADGRPTYSVALDGVTFIEPSPMGMLTNIGDFTSGMSLIEASPVTEIKDSYSLPNIKKSHVDYDANRREITFGRDGAAIYDVIFEVSNDNVAFRYRLLPQGETLCCIVEREATAFNMPEGTTTFLCPQSGPMGGFARTSPSYETSYTVDDVTGKNGWGEGYTFPCLFRNGDKGWTLVSETGIAGDYCASRLMGHEEGSYTIGYPQKGEMNGFGSTSAAIALPGYSPWRTITVGETLAPIAETTIQFDVVKPLYEKSQDFKYGKGVWSWIIEMDESCNFDEQKRYIDFAADMGYTSILVDALWDKQIGYDRIAELARYGHSKGVDLVLWYNSNGSWNDAPQGPRGVMNDIVKRRRDMAWMKSIGVRGIKVDFFGGDKQETMRLYHDILADANEYGLLVIFHGCTLPRGWERMYPNYAASEAVLASENLHFSQGSCDNEAFNATIHPFVRNAVGSMDFGGSALNKYYNTANAPGGSQRVTSDVFALATAVLFQSPLQHFALAPNNLTDAPSWAIDFMKTVPVTWDDTRFIDGYPGRYAVMARRHGDRWYIVGINATAEPLTFNLAPEMIAPGDVFTLYSDDKNLRGSVKEAKADKKGHVKVTVPTNGAFVIVKTAPEYAGDTTDCDTGAGNREHGTACNPLMWADVPDPDVIRVCDDYYMVSTTMHLMPGCPVMHSRDLVNWKVISYIFDTIEDNPRYHLEGGTVYGHGQWATSLRYHDGRFYALFSPNDDPYRSFIYTAENPAGPWELVSRTNHFHDSSLFFDDDGRVYVFSGSGDIHLTELNADLSGVKKDGIDQVIIRPDEDTAGLHEGTRVVKHDGKYYALVINWPAGRPRRQLCYRADNITGPYERMVVLQDNFAGFPYAAQGTIVDGADGNWWGIFFQDRGAVGRVLTLSPVTWIDGWPMVGDSQGHIPELLPVDAERLADYEIVSSDNFDKELNINWQWNHCPDNGAWSLSERPGYLRLHTSRPASSIYDAVNTLSQRMEGPCCDGIVRLDLSHMQDGDVAGFGAFNGHSTLLSVRCVEGKKYLVKHNTVVNFKENSKIIDTVDNEDEETVELPTDDIYLRIGADFRLGRDIANCQYSLDGRNWNAIGRDYKMTYDYRKLFMGQRYAIYNYATTTPGGYVDVDYFDYKHYQ